MPGFGGKPAGRALAAAALLVAARGEAGAQVFPRDTTPATIPLYQMPRPDYAPPDIKIGAFNLTPTVSEAAAFDDNIFASDNHSAGDFVNVTEENLALASAWSRDALSARVYGSQQIYANHDAQDADTYGGELSGQVDMGESSFFKLDLQAEQQPQSRATVEADTGLGARPIFNTWTGTADFFQRLDHWTAQAQFEFDQIAYLGDVDAVRSRVRRNYAERVGYDVSEQINVFFQTAYAQQEWRTRPDERNFDNLTAMIGVTVEIPTVISAEIALGALRQDFKDANLDTLWTPVVDAHVIWNVLPLTSVLLTVQRTATGTETFCPRRSGVCDTPLGVAFGPAARNTHEITIATFDVQHEIWHDLLGDVGFHYQRDDFDFNGLVDDTYALVADLRYLVNPYAELDLGYHYTTRTANFPHDLTYNSGPYTDNMITLELKISL